MRFLRYAIIALGPCYAPLSAALAQQAVQQRLDEARTLVGKHDYDAAIEQLRQARDAAGDADRARVDNALGWTLFTAGDAKGAQQQLEQAQRQAERSADADLKTRIANNLGVVLFSQGELEKARAQFEGPAARGSDLAIRYLGLIDEQVQANRVNELISEGIYARRALMFEAATEAYTKALELAPRNPRALEYRGYANYRLGRLDAALPDLERSRELDPANINTVINLLKVHCKARNGAAAERVAADARNLLLENMAVVQSDRELREVCGRDLARLLP
ncbi:tetratricopeptide (TPR) repeat protein [Constrictibacter sp. MBR-5]|jgi:tetratricopeptide (TPR) repeat protein|uniref:tetratricopeptide repeat protein n=1 Tax=Constrictibacter sp. MBR-5 TaxID=3156467 RepID=UPI003396FA55